MFLNLVGSWHIQNISLKHLSLKLTILLALTTSQRVQTLQVLSISNMTVRVNETNECVFVIDSVLKTTKTWQASDQYSDSGTGRQQEFVSSGTFKAIAG